jgi:hypothetical protein
VAQKIVITAIAEIVYHIGKGTYITTKGSTLNRFKYS